VLAALAGGYAVGHLADMDNIALPIFGEIYSWQLILIIIGLPGILVALLVLAIKEPLRIGSATATIPLSEVWNYLKKNGRQFFLLCGGLAFFYLAIYAISSWIPTFLMRVHGMDPTSVGKAVALGLGVFPAIGVVAGGRIADVLTQKKIPDAKVKFIFWVTVMLIPFCAVYPFMTSGRAALISMIPLALTLSAPVAVAAATVQEIMPNRMRGVASSILILSNNLLGLTLGPTIVGLMTDYVFKDEMALGWSLLIVTCTALLIATVFFFFALRKGDNAVTRNS